MNARLTRLSRRRILLAALAAGTMLAATVGAASARSSSTKLSLVAYSTPTDAYKELIPLFQKTDAGKDITFSTSFGSSGEQAAAVQNGLPADIVALSLAPDITVLSQAGLVSTRWNKDPFGGMVTNSVVVFVVRKGNPKGIKTWSDLIKPGVDVINANPFTSGGARWNVMAAYGAQIRNKKTPAQAQAYLKALYQHISVQDKSARDSLNTFLSGKGDVLLAYENEAIQAQQKGSPVDSVRPSSTILIENPIAVTKTSQHPAEAKAFIDFLRTDAAQDVFAKRGYRSIVPAIAKKWKATFPTSKFQFTIREIVKGGWPAAQKQFFDPDNGIVKRIQSGG